eukprot:1397010-Prymnesium_polylepis.2
MNGLNAQPRCCATAGRRRANASKRTRPPSCRPAWAARTAVVSSHAWPSRRSARRRRRCAPQCGRRRAWPACRCEGPLRGVPALPLRVGVGVRVRSEVGGSGCTRRDCG